MHRFSPILDYDELTPAYAQVLAVTREVWAGSLWPEKNWVYVGHMSTSRLAATNGW